MNLFVCAQCEKCMYLLYHNTVSHVSAYVEDTVHVHHKLTQPSAPTYGNRFSKKTKDKVRELKLAGEQPKVISQWLRDNLAGGYEELSTRQITDLEKGNKAKKAK